MKSFSDIYNSYFSSTAVYSYKEDERIFRTRFKRAWLGFFFAVVFLLNILSWFGIGANEYYYFILNLILINLIAAIIIPKLFSTINIKYNPLMSTKSSI